MGLETKYKRALRSLYSQYWSEAYEPARGSGLGYPDLQFMIRGIMLPVEVKCGEAEGGVLYPSAVRPSQINWHAKLTEAGGHSWLAVCCGPPSRMTVYAAPSTRRDTLRMWREGWELSQCNPWVLDGTPILDLSSLAVGIVKSWRHP